MSERLQKWLAGLGYGSRRELERWITAGRVTVDGERAELGMRVSGEERIVVDGKLVRVVNRLQKQRTIMYHKPPGELCSRTDPEGRRTVFDSLPRLRGARWVSVGRLDYQTTGLLLLTTDGELANKLMHPSAELEREYSVRVFGEVGEPQIQQLVEGVELDDGLARFDSLIVTGGEGVNKSCVVIVSEGRNRIIRRMFEAVDCRISRLLRLRYGPLQLPRELRQGKYRDVTASELAALTSITPKQR
jgi:23S rRNA pseudouridine2605 synthase